MPNPDTGTILVVEDEAELRSLLVAHLRSAGFEVLEAASGGDAIEVATARIPEIVLMDIGLPGMDGLSVTRVLKSDVRTAHIPVILLTARSSTNDVVRGLDAGAQEYIAKPFDVMELLARVQTVHRLARSRKDLDRLNTQLEAEVDAKTRRLQLLYEFMRDLNHAATRDEILDQIIRCVKEMTGAKRISLLLREEHTGNLVCERSAGIDPLIAEGIRVPTDEGIAGTVFRNRKTLAAKTYGARAEGEPAYAGDAFLSTPLVSTSLGSEECTLGVLNITERTDDRPFSEDEIDCIRSIADAAAIALDNVVRRARLQQSVRVLLQTVGLLAEYRDEETALHLERVTKMARILTSQLKREGPYHALITDGFIDSIVQAAPMHDIGKVGIPDDILTKPGKLTDEEFQIMKTHTDIGRRVLSRAFDPAYPVPQLQMCIDIAYCHHERWDGKGYPRRLAGTQIPLSARIITLVDAYDAMTSRRRYKSARSHQETLGVIRAEAGEHFDAVLVEAFLKCHRQFDEVRARYDDSVEAPVSIVS